jgi:hypothetical protein
METFTLSRKELHRPGLLKALCAGRVTTRQVAEALALKGLDAITTRKPSTSERPAKAFNDAKLFMALMSGEYAVHGFANRDLCTKPDATSLRLTDADGFSLRLAGIG